MRPSSWRRPLKREVLELLGATSHGASPAAGAEDELESLGLDWTAGEGLSKGMVTSSWL